MDCHERHVSSGLNVIVLLTPPVKLRLNFINNLVSDQITATTLSTISVNFALNLGLSAYAKYRCLT